MTKSIAAQYVAAFIPIAILCLIAFFSVDVSPALASALLRLAEIRAALAAARSLVGPLCASSDWLAHPGACERLLSAATLSVMPAESNGA
jgi:hypothetical protein